MCSYGWWFGTRGHGSRVRHRKTLGRRAFRPCCHLKGQLVPLPFGDSERRPRSWDRSVGRRFVEGHGSTNANHKNAKGYPAKLTHRGPRNTLLEKGGEGRLRAQYSPYPLSDRFAPLLHAFAPWNVPTTETRWGRGEQRNSARGCNQEPSTVRLRRIRRSGSAQRNRMAHDS